jgi:hypothetical protein
MVRRCDSSESGFHAYWRSAASSPFGPRWRGASPSCRARVTVSLGQEATSARPAASDADVAVAAPCAASLDPLRAPAASTSASWLSRFISPAFSASAAAARAASSESPRAGVSGAGSAPIGARVWKASRRPA